MRKTVQSQKNSAPNYQMKEPEYIENYVSHHATSDKMSKRLCTAQHKDLEETILIQSIQNILTLFSEIKFV